MFAINGIKVHKLYRSKKRESNNEISLVTLGNSNSIAIHFNSIHENKKCFYENIVLWGRSSADHDVLLGPETYLCSSVC